MIVEGDYKAAFEHIEKHIEWCLARANWNPDTMRRVLGEAREMARDRHERAYIDGRSADTEPRH